MRCISQLEGMGGCMTPSQNSSQEKKTLITERDELMATVKEILRTSNALMEKLKDNMRKFEELLKQKDKH